MPGVAPQVVFGYGEQKKVPKKEYEPTANRKRREIILVHNGEQENWPGNIVSPAANSKKGAFILFFGYGELDAQKKKKRLR